MRNAGIVVFYFATILIGIALFLSIRWFVLNGNPVFYESTQKKVMTPDQVRIAGFDYETGKLYFQVETKKTYLKSGKFPRIEKEVTLNKALEVVVE